METGRSEESEVGGSYLRTETVPATVSPVKTKNSFSVQILTLCKLNNRLNTINGLFLYMCFL